MHINTQDTHTPTRYLASGLHASTAPAWRTHLWYESWFVSFCSVSRYSSLWKSVWDGMFSVAELGAPANGERT